MNISFFQISALKDMLLKTRST